MERIKFISCLVFMLFFIVIFNSQKVLAYDINMKMKGNDETNGYQYIYDKDNNLVFCVEVIENGNIYFTGRHAASKTTYTYHTTGFTMALKFSNQNPTSLPNHLRIERLVTNLADECTTSTSLFWDDRYTYDTYRLDSESVISNLVTLLKNEGYSNQGAYKKIANGVDVYFSNIFEVVLREGMVRVGTEEYYSYNGIINSIKELKGGNWSKETVELLNSYYDNKINIRLSPFFYDVVYVDANEYKKKGKNATQLGTTKENLEIFFGQNAEYELPSKLNFKNIDYSVKSVEYVYDSGKTNAENKPKISNNVVTAYHGSKQNATLYVLLEKQEETPVTSVPTMEPTSTENSISYVQPNATGAINVQPIPFTGYDAKIGVPTTENLYGTIQTSEYLLKIIYEKKSGQITYPITVQRTYNVTTKVVETVEIDPSTQDENGGSSGGAEGGTDHKDLEGDGSPTTTTKITYVTTQETVTQTGTVTRPYSYTEIASIEYYKIKDGTLTNQTLPEHVITLTPKNYSVPELKYQHYTNEQHIKAPSEIGTTIVLSSSDVTSIPNEDLVSIGAGRVGQIQVRSDYLTFGGKTVLSSGWKSRNAATFQKSAIAVPQKTEQKVLYQDNLLIEATLKNKTYPSNGTITYEKVVKYNSSNSNLLTYPVGGINDVKIHTPVFCESIVTHDNSKYLQLMNPDFDCIPLIIDENSMTGDFTLKISNEGFHSKKGGYGNKSYIKYLASIDGMSQNEVKFPIEMYEDVGNDGKASNDRLVKANEWICIGTMEQRFYLPMWVKEGIYTVEIRSVAVNGSDELTKTEQIRNTEVNHYVATDTFKIQASGRFYGLILYDIQDYPLWQEVFRRSDGITLKRNQTYSQQLKDNDNGFLADGVLSKGFKKTRVYDYTVGVNTHYGDVTKRLSNYTFPLMIGAHPRYTNQGMMKTGYTVRFQVTTNGNEMAKENASLEITPRFYYVDATGTNRTEVDLYYQAMVANKNYSLIQIGSGVDSLNTKTLSVGDTLLSIPEEEMMINAKAKGMTMAKFKALTKEVYTYGKIRVESPFRMLSNLQFANNFEDAQHSKIELQALKQTYYFTYSLPDKVKATKKGTDVATYAKQNGIDFTEDFWLKDGYLIVNFDLVALDAEGNIRYSYINKDNYIKNQLCSMWLMEGGAQNKTDTNGLSIQFLAGDTLIFSTNETASDDYSTDGIY